MVMTSDPPCVKLGPMTRTVTAEGALFTRGVRTLEDPVLPRGEPSEDLGLDRLRAREAQARLPARRRVARAAHAPLDREAHLIVPVDLVEHRGHESQLVGLLRFETDPDDGRQCVKVGRLAEETAGETGVGSGRGGG